MDPLRIEADYIGWAAYWDPEGPIGRGKTKERALLELFSLCDDHHREALLAGAIVEACDVNARVGGTWACKCGAQNVGGNRNCRKCTGPAPVIANSPQPGGKS